MSAVSPTSVLTVSVTVYSPALTYACDAVTPVPCAPSPKSQRYSVIEPPGAFDALPSNLIASLTAPGFGEIENSALGAPAAATVTAVVTGSAAVPTRESAAVKLTVYLPGVANVCVGAGPVPSDPS